MSRLLRLLFHAVLLAGLVSSVPGAQTPVAFTLEIEGNGNTPTVRLRNESRVAITGFEMTVGNFDYNFDSASGFSGLAPGGSVSVHSPDTVNGGVRTDTVSLTLAGLDSGRTLVMTVDVDADGADSSENFRRIFFNNGQDRPNASVKVTLATGESATLELPDGAADLGKYVFASSARPRSLVVRSVTEAGGTEFVNKVTVKINGEEYGRDVGDDATPTYTVYDGENIEVTAPQEVFRNIYGDDISDSVANDPNIIQDEAEERFTATGISVNDVVQSGDPTLLRLRVEGNAAVTVKWRHEYALTIEHDFGQTESQERDPGGTAPWAGPLTSNAEGDPQPPAKKNWIKKGETVIAQVGGEILDFNRPGLDIRYVPAGYVAAGPPNRRSTPQDALTSRQALLVPQQILDPAGLLATLTSGKGNLAPYLWGRFSEGGTNILGDAAQSDLWAATLASELNAILGDPGNAIYEATRFAGIALRPETEVMRDAFLGAGLSQTEIVRFNRLLLEDAFPSALARTRLAETLFPFVVRQAQPQRQQVPQFTMSGPGLIRYAWKLQFGVRVNADDPRRAALPRVYQVTGGTAVEVGSGEGTFWFDPGATLRVLSPANEAGPDSLALRGWFNGDGHYFSSQGTINSQSGALDSGGPAERPGGGGPVANWLDVFVDPQSQIVYRGLHIPQLLRSARVFWRYDRQAVRVLVDLGQHVFQDAPGLAASFTTPPESIELLAVSGANKTVGVDDLTFWDPVAQRLYPLVPATLVAKWRPNPASADTMDVTIEARYPNPAHYPHIAGAPPVALDPDPADTFVFKDIRYTETDAAVDSERRFTATAVGKTVLRFAELQRDGRGIAREFVRIRVVETRDWEDRLSQGTATIGQKIVDPNLDLAQLGTGYVYDPTGTARYNPFIYDAAKLAGLAARDIYDMAALRSDRGEKIVVSRDNLPGPVIPVNLFPGAAKDQRVIVIWYDDPAANDLLMWPHRAGVYQPAWPTTAAEGLGRIVIASQFGSESLDPNGEDQVVTPSAPGVPEETTFNPSRFQSVQIYVQPDPDFPGYNPNEEHALLAPSLRFADVSPRPPAAYALRDNDLNRGRRPGVTDAQYTSDPFVLVQFFDTLTEEHAMRVYRVVKEDPNIPGYRFAPRSLITPATGRDAVSTSVQTLNTLPFVRMEAGEPVIPFYPLGVVIGASPSPETFGVNLKGQSAYWEDWRGSSWAVSGDENSWFTVSFHYPLAPDFWWPDGDPGRLRLVKSGNAVQRLATVPEVGDSVSFLPLNVGALLALAPDAVVDPTGPVPAQVEPVRVLYKADWPENPPVLKAGETLTFAGGEFRSDRPFRTVDGRTVETSGLPGIVAFASAEVVFDSLNPTGNDVAWKETWTARVAQVLDRRWVPLDVARFPTVLQPATGRTRVRGGKYVFNDLPSSLQRRVLYDPLAGQLEVIGLLNDKRLGDATLTAAPPAVYVLEPNILTEEERVVLRALDGEGADSDWDTAIDLLCRLSRNPELVDTDNTFFFDLPVDDSTAGAWQTRLEQFWRHYYFGVLPSDSAVAGVLDDLPTLVGLGATDPVPTPLPIASADSGYLVGLEPARVSDRAGRPVTVTEIDPSVDAGDNAPQPAEFPRPVRDPRQAVPLRAYGPGLALLPNPGFLDPLKPYPTISWVTVVENNDERLGGSPITVHVIQVDRRERYRGSIKTIESDNVFDENLVLRHTGDFGANADELSFEWWYRFDDGSLNVPPPDLLKPGQVNPWKVFPDPTGNRGRGRATITLKGNPNVPEALLADSFWFVRYRHNEDVVQGADWSVSQPDGSPGVNFTWAGAGNSDPFNDLDGDGLPDYRAQLAQGWIKRVLDAVNPYEARIRDFEGDSPSTVVSMIAQFGRPFEGPVALNPDKNVIENVGLIELYETILRRGRNLSIDLTRPVSTPAIANALQLASTRISDFYTLLGNEAYVDAQDGGIGVGGGSAEGGAVPATVFPFQNQLATVLEEELALLRGVDDFFARPVYNRLFWNFTKGEGEASYAVNYDITDVSRDGFINEDDAMLMFPQGHGDAWGHYLTALRNQYELLGHPNFNWVSRSEFYNLQDIVLKVDFLDERKFAQTAAAKARTGAEIVNLTYRSKYVEDPTAQWQGYTDSNPDRAWGVEEWARRAGQGAYFDWVTANALLPSTHPNATLEGIQKVDRKSNADIAVISANLNGVQHTFDQANRGYNPLGLAPNVVPFDVSPQLIDDLVFGMTHFEQIADRATRALANAEAIRQVASEGRNQLRRISNGEAEFRNAVFQEDVSYRNQLIKIFGKPYEGTIGPGRVYPAGYDGPDLLLFMYVDVRELSHETVPGPVAGFVAFNENGTATSDSPIYKAFENGQGSGSDARGTLANIQTIPPELRLYLSDSVRELFAPTFVDPSGSAEAPILVRDGLYAVNYTDLESPKVPLDGLTQILPVTAAGYTFQAPREWGRRKASGELQMLITKMLQSEASIAEAIGAYDGLQGQILRELRFINAKLDSQANIRLEKLVFTRVKYVVSNLIKGIEGGIEILKNLKETTVDISDAAKSFVPDNFPTAGLSFSPGDAAFAAVAGIDLTKATVKTSFNIGSSIAKALKLVAEIGLDIAENELALFELIEGDAIEVKELLKNLENLVGDEPIRRITIFKEIQALRELSDQYRALADEGARLIDQRTAFNKRVAAQVQRDRYHDMTFRVSRNHATQNYREAFHLAARYVYLAAKAYDYETNFDPSHPASPSAAFAGIVRAREIGLFDGEPRFGAGGLSESLAWLKTQYALQKGQLGINNPQFETGKISLRTELYRILPVGSAQPTDGGASFPNPGADSDTLWREVLERARVPDLWLVPEYRQYCRPAGASADSSGNPVAEPGLVLRFGTRILKGQNFFGRPLSGADHAYDPSQFATKIRGVGVSIVDYLSADILGDLPVTPRVYLVPVGIDVMSLASGDDPGEVRLWKVVDQRIPVPLPAQAAQLDSRHYIPLLDSLSGRLGEPRKFASFRAYDDAGATFEAGDIVLDGRLIGRSVWNTQWLLIIPGSTLNADPDVGLERFIDQVTDIKLVFQTYGYSGD